MRELPATISFAAITPGAPACELCSVPGGTVNTLIVVQHPRGGRVELAACAHCVSALRRVAAAAGDFAHFVLASAAPAAGNTGQIREHGTVTVAVECFHEYATLLRDADGIDYRARACGGERPDGTWIGWLEFHPVGGGLVWRTERETTQPNRAALVYWTGGLEPQYLEGAFSRARALAKAV
jgi:hypothetical protein